MESSRDDITDTDSEESNSLSNSSVQIAAALLAVNAIDLQKVMQSNIALDPLQAAEQTGPRIYHIKNHNNENVHFYVFGCQGDLKSGQARVAALIEERITAAIFAQYPALEETYHRQVKEHPELKSRFIKELLAEYPEFKPDFIILLGDNVYPHGVNSPEDKRFLDQFYEMYGIRCFVIPGNHDFGYTKKEKINYTSSTAAGKARGMHQVTHSYKAHPNDPLLAISKAEFWNQVEIDITQLPRWCMPWFFYSFIFDKLQLFFLDSSHIADDYLKMLELLKQPEDRRDNYIELSKKLSKIKELIIREDYAKLEKLIDLQQIKKPNDSKDKVLLNFVKNQAIWLILAFKECKDNDRTPLLFLHHPTVDYSKRARYGEGDAHLYFKTDPARWTKLAKRFSLEEYNYKHDALISHIFAELGINATTFTAHVHAMYNVVSPEHRLFVVGSGGGDLQERVCFRNPKHTGLYLQELGFLSVDCNKKNPRLMEITAHTVSGRELKLTQEHAKPITKIDDPDTAELHHLVLNACNEYAVVLANLLAEADKKNKANIDFYPYLIAKLRNTTNEPTLHDTHGLHDIMAYFCKPMLEGFQTELNKLDEFLNKLSQKNDGSLYDIINKTIQQSRFGKTVKQLLDNNVLSDAATTSPLFLKYTMI